MNQFSRPTASGCDFWSFLGWTLRKDLKHLTHALFVSFFGDTVLEINQTLEPLSNHIFWE